MAIKHADVKASGQRGFASEWNKDHVIEGNVDFRFYAAENMLIHSGVAFPVGPVAGQIFYRSDEKQLYIWNGTEWKFLLKRTSYWSCGGTNFHGINPDTDQIRYGAVWNDDEEWVSPEQDNMELIANVNLPDGAVVTGCIAYGNATASTKSWYLVRTPLDDATVQPMSSANIGIENTTITNATVDNSLYRYNLSVAWLKTGDTIYGARITYTL